MGTRTPRRIRGRQSPGRARRATHLLHLGRAACGQRLGRRARRL